MMEIDYKKNHFDYCCYLLLFTSDFDINKMLLDIFMIKEINEYFNLDHHILNDNQNRSKIFIFWNL